MKPAVDFIFDFASPNAYLCHDPLNAIAVRTGASVNLVPCLLGGIFKATGNQAPMNAFAGVRGKLAYDGLETRRFVEKHGLARFRMNPHFPLNSLMAMRGLVAAGFEGDPTAYCRAVMEGFWELGRRMDDPEVLRDTLAGAGLDADRLLARTQDPVVKQRLLDTTLSAVDRGAFGIPTFFVGDDMYFGKERLGQVEERLRSL